MDDTKPIINLNNAQVDGSCLSVTPTPTTTPLNYCYFNELTYITSPFQCPNDGLTYEDIYGVIKLQITVQGIVTSNHPDYSFTVSNGTESETLILRNGQSFIEYSYLKKNFVYTATGCTETNYPDFVVTAVSPSIIECFVTPTPTPSQTPTHTPTLTQTPTPTRFSPGVYAPIWVDFSDLTSMDFVNPDTIRGIENKGNWLALTGFTASNSLYYPNVSGASFFTGVTISAATIGKAYLDSNINMTGSNWTTIVVVAMANNSESVLLVNVDNKQPYSPYSDNQQKLWNPTCEQPFEPPNFVGRFFKQMITIGPNPFNPFEYRANISGYTQFSKPHIIQSYLSTSGANLVSNFYVNGTQLNDTLNGNATLYFSGFPGSINANLSIINQYIVPYVTNGQIGEIIMYDRELTLVEMSEIYSYLSNKWGITGAYPIPTPTATRTPTPTVTPSKTATPTVTPSNTATPTVTPTISLTPSNTPTVSITASNTPTPSITSSPTVSPTKTTTPTPTPTTPFYTYRFQAYDSSCNPVGTPITFNSYLSVAAFISGGNWKCFGPGLRYEWLNQVGNNASRPFVTILSSSSSCIFASC